MAQQRNAVTSNEPYAAQPQTRRGVRSLKRAFRIVRNALAILGVVFAYLLWTGFTQYQERIDAGDTTCTLTHCA